MYPAIHILHVTKQKPAQYVIHISTFTATHHFIIAENLSYVCTYRIMQIIQGGKVS